MRTSKLLLLSRGFLVSTFFMFSCTKEGKKYEKGAEKISDKSNDKGADKSGDKAVDKAGEREKGSSTGQRAAGKEKGPREIAVEVQLFKQKDYSYEFKVPVILEGRRQVQVFSRNLGKIIGPLARSGSYVKEGAKLFAVDRSEPGESYLPAPVFAPISGKLAEWFLSESETISPQQPAALLVDDYALRAQVPLPAEDWKKFSPRAKISLNFAGIEKEARVISSGVAVQAETSRALVAIEVPNATKDWSVGLTAVAKVIFPPEKKWIVSSEALVLTNEGTFIYVLEGDKALRKKIEFTLLSNDFVEVLQPIFPEDTAIITSGFAKLSNGAKVKVTSEIAEKSEQRK